MTFSVAACLSGYHGQYCQWLTNQTCAGANNTRFGCTPGHTSNCIDHLGELDGRQISVGGEIITVVFECRCNDGVVGDLCEEVVPYCNRYPCTNPDQYHRCIINYTNPSIPHCICKTGYGGEECEIDVDLCENSPCLHNGTCKDHGTYYSCHCPRGYGGIDCSIERCTANTIMLGLIGILTLDQNVHVMMVALEADVKLALTHVKTTLALMEELALVLEFEGLSLVIVQLDILESLVLFACNHFVPALFLDVKRREIMEYVM